MPAAQARSELIRPLVRGFQNHATPFPTDQNLVLSQETAGLGKPDRLTPPVLKQLCAVSLHTQSLDVCIYSVKSSGIVS